MDAADRVGRVGRLRTEGQQNETGKRQNWCKPGERL
jgi:hypothetical protein